MWSAIFALKNACTDIKNCVEIRNKGQSTQLKFELKILNSELSLEHYCGFRVSQSKFEANWFQSE